LDNIKNNVIIRIIKQLLSNSFSISYTHTHTQFHGLYVSAFGATTRNFNKELTVKGRVKIESKQVNTTYTVPTAIFMKLAPTSKKNHSYLTDISLSMTPNKIIYGFRRTKLKT